MGSCRWLVLLGIDVFHNHGVRCIHEITIEVRGVFLLLLTHLEAADGRVMSLLAGGAGGDADQFSTLIVV